MYGMMINLKKKGGNIVNKIISFLSKASVLALTLVLFSVANTSSSFYFHQPREPKTIEDFKWIK